MDTKIFPSNIIILLYCYFNSAIKSVTFFYRKYVFFEQF